MSTPDLGPEDKPLNPIGALDADNHFAVDFGAILSDHFVFRTSDKIDSEEIEIENAPRLSNAFAACLRDGTPPRSKEFKGLKLRRVASNPRHRFPREKVD